jgi:Xaa-Pro aminopeptidase
MPAADMNHPKPPAYLASRQQRIQDRLRENGLDALLTQHPPHLRYASLFTGSTGMAVFTAAGRPWLLIDPRYTAQARSEARGFHVRECAGALERAGAELLRELGVRRVGFESRRTTLSAFRNLARMAPGKIEWVEAEELLARLRAVKDLHELELLRGAAKLTCEMCDVIIRLLVPGACEQDIAAEMQYRLLKKGASGISFETIVASGWRSALPHGVAARKTLQPNEFVVVDFGVVLEGYCSDMTRTFYLGNAGPRERRIHRAVREALESAEAAMRSGVTAARIDSTARGILARRRLGRYFTHATGHGLGIEVHEFPGLRHDCSETLSSGMVVTIEPGVYIPGWGGVRIEDMVAVQDRGCEVLTPFTHDLICL